MKNLETILKQDPVYLHNWQTKNEVITAFDCPPEVEQQPIRVLFASYGSDGFEGKAFVLFECEGKLFEVNGSHCSCFGLEGQFIPHETTIEALRHRLVNGTMGRDDYSGNEFANELKQFLGVAQVCG